MSCRKLSLWEKFKLEVLVINIDTHDWSNYEKTSPMKLIYTARICRKCGREEVRHSWKPTWREVNTPWTHDWEEEDFNATPIEMRLIK